jgi:RHS repeat-associated protein
MRAPQSATGERRVSTSRHLGSVIGLLLLCVATAAQAQTSPNVVEYYHLDALGSVRAVTNQSGAVVRTHDYRPFGEGENPVAGSEPTRFTGKERDAESGLDYVGARYYANRTGRFTTVDPGHVGGNIFDPQSWNAYAYARNNPLRFVDPTGTDYLVNTFGGEPFWADTDRDLRALEEGGFSFRGGVILDSANTWVGTYQYAAGALAIFGTVVAPVPMAIASCVAAGPECSVAGTAMAVLPGGRLRFVFKTAHYAPRLTAVGLNVKKVETAVEQVVRSLRPVGEVSGRMKVDGVLIQWRAFILPDGTINIGTIHPVW